MERKHSEVVTFTDVIVWQKAHALVLTIYKSTENYPSSEKFGLTNQIRRAAVSVCSNFVEGFRRKDKKVRVNYYDIASGSLEEVKYQLLLSKDLLFITESEYQEMKNQTEQVGRLLHAWKLLEK